MLSLFPFELWLGTHQSDECSMLQAFETREEAESELQSLLDDGYRAWIVEVPNA